MMKKKLATTAAVNQYQRREVEEEKDEGENSVRFTRLYGNKTMRLNKSLNFHTQTDYTENTTCWLLTNKSSC
jgi:hypothetical protein